MLKEHMILLRSGTDPGQERRERDSGEEVWLGNDRQNSLLSCRYPPTLLCPKQEHWAAVLPFPLLLPPLPQ